MELKILNKNKFYIAPSILSADFSDIKNILSKLEDASIEIVHFDVMDNHFVPNLTFGHKFIKDLRPHSTLFFDTHLMIDNPDKYIGNYIEAGCDNITFHIEASKDPFNTLKSIKEAGLNCGISIKPNTKVDEIIDYLDMVDIVLIMTVEPGFGGQKMIESTVEKIQQLKQLNNKNNYNFFIEADGGIGINNIKQLKNLGLDIAVMGSAFFKNKDYKEFRNSLKNL